ncbi:MAG TPA: aminoglycoside adenylyltransferase domain-containing protein [Anaerolineae bacterium]|nr:aminoglycoside adenylyltransferase domain-containing protein [Anaerolineae bacterium]
MSTQIAQPTPCPDVNAVLHELLSGVQSILGNHFIGMYLYGSLAIGDFNPHRSDIDFVVVTAAELPDEMLPTLDAMHVRIAAGGSTWAAELEGSYIPQRALRRYDPAQARHPHMDMGGDLRVEQHDSDWVIQRHILREHGVVLAGPAPHTLIDPVVPDELRQAVLDTLRGWWAPMLDDPARLHSPRYQVYAVLTMCRMIYTLRHGTVVSKSVAARWAQDTLGGRWTELIERASAWRNGMPFDHLSETLDLIRYTLERSQYSSLNAPSPARVRVAADGGRSTCE